LCLYTTVSLLLIFKENAKAIKNKVISVNLKSGVIEGEDG
jgi:hypothetical protein